MGFLQNVHLQGEFAALGQQSLLASLELLGEIVRMTAQSLGTQGDEVFVPLLDLIMGAFSRSGRVHAALGSSPTFAVHENEEGSKCPFC
jgi:hypothetical protein